MLIASGNIDMSALIDGIILMAKDENEKHERNQKEPAGSWLHDSGWGIAYLQDDEWVIHRSLKAIFADPDLDYFRKVKTNLVIIHARKVTLGKISLENTHPFFVQEEFGGVIFCHNGTIFGEIPYDQSYYQAKGDTDSERLFYFLLTSLKNDNIIKVIRKNMAFFNDYSGINFIFSTKEKSFIHIKENQYHRYYQMKLARKEGMLVISSEKLPSLGKTAWQGLEQGDITIIENGKDEVTFDKTTAL